MMPRQVRNIHQQGFSLLEVLVATLIAAVAVGGTMWIHAQNLRSTSDNAQLNRAQMVLSNLVQRMQVNRAAVLAGSYDDVAEGLDNSGQKEALKNVVNQANEAGLIGAQFSVVKKGGDERLVTLKWNAHDVKNPVWRIKECGTEPNKNERHCLGMLVRP